DLTFPPQGDLYLNARCYHRLLIFVRVPLIVDLLYVFPDVLDLQVDIIDLLYVLPDIQILWVDPVGSQLGLRFLKRPILWRAVHYTLRSALFLPPSAYRTILGFA